MPARMAARTPARSARRSTVAAGAIAAILLAGCTGATATPPPSATVSPPPSPSASEPAAFACPVTASSLEVPSNRLVGVAVNAKTGYDEVTFTFGEPGQGSGATPTVDIARAEPPFVKAPSGFPLTVAGSSFIRLTFRETIVADDAGTPTQSGSTDLTPAGAAVREVVRAEAFEGVSDWLVGVAGPACARVRVDPTAKTLVLDVQAP